MSAVKTYFVINHHSWNALALKCLNVLEPLQHAVLQSGVIMINAHTYIDRKANLKMHLDMAFVYVK